MDIKKPVLMQWLASIPKTKKQLNGISSKCTCFFGRYTFFIDFIFLVCNSLLPNVITVEAGHFYYASTSAFGLGYFEGDSEWTKKIFRKWRHTKVGSPIVRLEFKKLYYWH